MLPKLLKRKISNTYLFILYNLTLLLAYFIPGNLFFEWIISFMPFFLVANIAIIVFFWKRKHSFSRILLYLVTILMLVRIIDFAYIKPLPGSGMKELKVLFLNKLFYNANYSEIDTEIRKVNPDIIGMAEMGEKEIEYIPVLKDYPYFYVTNIPDNKSTALFSKYMFSAGNSPFSQNGIVSKMDIDGKDYQVLVLHPSAPVLPSDLSSRNEEIKNLSAYIQSLGNARIILLGDFNLTPWSPVYTTILSPLKNIKSAEKGSGLFTTYHLGPFQVLIDHIFVSNEFTVESFYIKYIQGSDHKLIWTRLKI